MKTIFKSKEQYLAMRAQWAISSQSPKCKSTLVSTDEILTDANGREYISKNTGTRRIQGWMQAEHHILYNLVRGKPSDNGFCLTPNKKTEKPNKFYNALYVLRCNQQLASKVSKNKISIWSKTYSTAAIKEYLAPFGDTLTLEQFLNLDIPKIDIVESSSYTEAA